MQGPTLNLTITGLGLVSGPPSRLYCSDLYTGWFYCNPAFPQGTTVTLQTFPAQGWRLGSWGGACSGSGTCTVTINGNQSVTANFIGGAFLSISPPSRSDSVANGSAIRPDSALVVFTGTGGSAIGWTAVKTKPWVTLTKATGTGPGMLRWTRDPAGLAAGTYVDTITVTSPGAANSPSRLIDTLVVVNAPVLTLARSSSIDSVVVGSSAIQADSEAVNISGFSASAVAWSASHGTAQWLTLITSSGTGSGMLRWTKNPADLPVGSYVDTIVINSTGTLGAPARIIDSLLILSPLTVSIGPASRRDSLPQGSTAVRSDSAVLTFSGMGAASAVWNVTHGGGAWIVIETENGAGSAKVHWTRSPLGLLPGIHVDTITIAAASALGSPSTIIDSLFIYEPPVALGCATSDFLASPCLGTVEKNYLDVTGNHDGAYNVGDLLAYLDRKNLTLSPELVAALLGVSSQPLKPQVEGTRRGQP